MAQKISPYDKERIDEFISLFSKESPRIREVLSTSLPAYNTLLNLHALSWEEFALLPIARKQGLNYEDPLFDFSAVKPPCPHCGEEQRIRQVKQGLYTCNKCLKRFAANHNSISSNTGSSSLTWLKVLKCILNCKSIEETISYCDISRDTFYTIRTRLFYAMELLMKDIKLYGITEADITFSRANYKGMDLNRPEYPEDSIFDDVSFVPRTTRFRGGHYRMDEKNQNSICIFTAIDEYGHSVCKFIGIGAANSRRLMTILGDDLILPLVPKEDPFSYAKRDAKASIERAAGAPSCLVSDMEGAIIKYAHMCGLESENHVYRSKGQQLRLPAGSHNIQRVNSLHRRLKEFLRANNYVSTKYLPGFLVLFDFLENTKATDAAIGRLFEILATPGLGKSKDFYDDLYTVPNYMAQWKDDDGPLRNYAEDDILCAYLYAKKLENKSKGAPEISMDEIRKQTTYSPHTVRRKYKNFFASGLMPLIFARYESKINDKQINRSRSSSGVTAIPMYELEIFDEFVAHRSLLSENRPSIAVFLKRINQKYGISWLNGSLYYHMNKIVELGLRDPYPDMDSRHSKTRETEIRKGLELFEWYQSLERSYREKNEPFPGSIKIKEIIAEEMNLSFSRISYLIGIGRKAFVTNALGKEQESK